MDRKKKIGIITFHCAENYGAFLQAYAMQEWLRSFARQYEVQIIDYRPDFLFAPYKISLPDRLRSTPGKTNKIKAIILFGTELPYKIIRKIKFHKSWKLFQLTNRSYHNSNFLLNDDYFAVILGSDQIWNPNITGGLDPVYFGTVSSKDCRKIAYAASIGVKTYTDDEYGQLTTLMNGLKSIGVREKASIDVLEPISKQEVVINADPTILVDRTIWKSLLRPVKDSRYILIYKLQENDSILADAYNLAKKSGRTILHFGDPSIKQPYPDVRIKSLSFCGPCEFLSYIYNADLVLTNSFHATCFSIIFNKNFFTYLQESRSERITSIASIGNFEDRLVKYKEHLQFSEKDWSRLSNPKTIYEYFSELKRDSEAYLINNLTEEKGVIKQ